tara:strand:- start:920 stop:1141 length:222 start_codon:yes stop_codon:yes gene_type:complete
MTIWLACTFFTILGMVIFRKKKPKEENLEPPSNLIMFFDPIEGEGDLFLGGLLVIFFSSRFFLELFQTLRLIF